MIEILNGELSLSQQNNKAMPYTRKISKKSNSFNETEKNIDVVLDSISNGASIEVIEHWNKTEYIVSYPEGGRYKISKRIYDKLSKA